MRIVSTRLFSATLVLTGLCFADTITLRNGTVVQGTYLGGDARRVKVAVGDRIDSYSVDELVSIQFGGGNPPPPPDQSYTRTPDDREQRTTDAPPPPPPPPSDQAYNRSPDAPPPPPPAADGPRYYRDDRAYNSPPPVLVPAGTALVVRMIDPVDSERDRMGQTYRASIDEPVLGPDNQIVITRGADVIVKLVDDTQSGKIEGRTVLTLDLMQVQVNGRMLDVNTSDVSQSSGSRGARSGKVIGGATALGAIIGAIAGGGKGAAIGAGSGAAVGTGAEVMTKGQRVRIPSETRLTFTLQQPLLQPMQ